MPNNVLYINATSEIAGGEMSFYNCLRAMDRKTFHPVVVLPGEGHLLDLLREINVETIVMPFNRLNKKNPLSLLPYLTTVFRLARIIKKWKIRIVHVNMSNASQFGSLAGKLARVPVICHMRNPSIGKIAYNRELVFLSNLLIANSKATEESYKEFMRPAQRSRVIYNSIVPDEYEREDADNDFRQRYGLDNKVFLIGCAAQIDPRKGQHVLLEALAKLANKYPGAHVFLAGSAKPFGVSEYSERLKSLVKELGISDRVTFAGFVKDLAPMYKSFDLFVLPTLWEAFGRVLIEAMAAGKPVISSRVGGIPEVVEDGVSGLLVPPEDPEALAKAIDRLMDKPELAKNFGEKGRERVRKYFNAETNTRQLEEIYYRMIGDRGCSASSLESKTCEINSSEQ